MPSTRFGWTHVPPASSQGKKVCIKCKAEVRMGFFLAPVGFVFQACSTPHQRFLGTTTF